MKSVPKEEILAEIRRTAAENRGRPLGMGRFSEETGIQKSDWLGRYWARWGDALREAGFEPNTLQTPYETDSVAQRYGELVRELGHIPVKAELLMKTRQDTTSPAVTTVARHLGTNRGVIVPRVLEYCRQSANFDDVAKICEDWIATNPGREPRGRAEKKVTLGHVYLLKSGRYYKIGRSNAVGRRERELAIQLPQRGAIVHSIATDDPVGIETYWHRRFESKRGNGEWFNLSPEDVAAFRRRKSM